MFPKATLPDAAFVTCHANRAEPLVLRQRPREPGLDQPPSRREIVIVRRQLPDRVQMIWQHDERVDREGVVSPRYGNGFAQMRDLIDEQRFPSLQQIDREEPAAARNEGAT